MSTKTVNTQSSVFIVVIFLGTVLFILVLGGCALNPTRARPRHARRDSDATLRNGKVGD